MGWPLLGVSVAALAITGERVFFFLRHPIRCNSVRMDLKSRLERQDFSQIHLKNESSPLEVMAKGYLANLEKTAQTRRLVAQSVMDSWVSHARGPVRYLSMLAQIAPLLGLTGTVLGLVEAFKVIELSTTMANPSMLAGGIWAALLTTVVGMLISIPLMVVIRAFNHRIDIVIREARELFVWLECKVSDSETLTFTEKDSEKTKPSRNLAS